ncbi:hypothetical protein ACHAWF_014853, partial [Thalassiosira exigua]
MVYIGADGSIAATPPPTRNPIKEVTNCTRSLSPQAVIAIAGIAVVCSRSNIFDFSPLANGAIPATKRQPQQHWGYMAKDVSFMRSMTDSLVGKTKAKTKEGKWALKEYQTKRFLDGVDFGGPDGHGAEETDFVNLEEIRVTRCSTTNSGITAYFCGAAVATDMDLAHGYNRKLSNVGTDSFREYLRCRRRQGLRDGSHHRSVYRLGISCKNRYAGYSHAFSIVAQPDGTFLWLQSYIQKYSLSTWLNKVDDMKESGLAGHLTYNELMAKLDTIDRLMNIDSWTSQANYYYLDLFNVYKDSELASGNRRRQIKEWTHEHRLEKLTWDEACEYPLPDEYLAEGQRSSQNGTSDGGGASGTSDECAVLLGEIHLSSLFGRGLGGVLPPRG